MTKLLGMRLNINEKVEVSFVSGHLQNLKKNHSNFGGY